MGEPVNPDRKRPYHAPRRRQRAQETGRRIVAAARRLFADGGYTATPLTAVAAAAGVAVETLYAHFPSKRALLGALIESAVDEGMLRDLLRDTLGEPDPRRRLYAVARHARRIYDSSWDVLEVLREAGSADAAAAGAWHDADQRARAVQAPIVEALAERGTLARALGADEAADLLWTLAGPDVYRLLVSECGWSPERYELQLGRILAALLLEP